MYNVSAAEVKERRFSQHLVHLDQDDQEEVKIGSCWKMLVIVFTRCELVFMSET